MLVSFDMGSTSGSRSPNHGIFEPHGQNSVSQCSVVPLFKFNFVTIHTGANDLVFKTTPLQLVYLRSE